MTRFGYKKIIVFLVIPYFLDSCNSPKEIYYSYNIETITVDTVARLYQFGSLISYGNYLFEFKTRIHFDKKLYPDPSKNELITYFDTTGVYLLSNATQQYCEFDSFGLTGKVIKKGTLSDKEFGFKVSSPGKSDSSETMYGTIKEVSINNIDCYYVDIIPKRETADDTVKTKMTLVKKDHFNSLYRTNGIEFMNKEYCFVGYNIYYPAKNEYLRQEIKNLRYLTENEKNICRNMLKVSGL